MGKSKKNPPIQLSSTHPLAQRKTLYTISEKRGEVISLDATNFGIRQSQGDDVLLPVNLPGEFQQNGIRVKFSAQVKEISLTELWAGQPVLLTHIEKI